MAKYATAEYLNCNGLYRADDKAICVDRAKDIYILCNMHRDKFYRRVFINKIIDEDIELWSMKFVVFVIQLKRALLLP